MLAKPSTRQRRVLRLCEVGTLNSDVIARFFRLSSRVTSRIFLIHWRRAQVRRLNVFAALHVPVRVDEALTVHDCLL